MCFASVFVRMCVLTCSFVEGSEYVHVVYLIKVSIQNFAVVMNV